ncbi:MAG: hypothetical protein OEY49_06335 [Candidatus Heimdallarchaeota archaeon]|nr:hypothetical protein [Candidatus Heimdallarchaeota archaeon]
MVNANLRFGLEDKLIIFDVPSLLTPNNIEDEIFEILQAIKDLSIKVIIINFERVITAISQGIVKLKNFIKAISLMGVETIFVGISGQFALAFSKYMDQFNNIKCYKKIDEAIKLINEVIIPNSISDDLLLYAKDAYKFNQNHVKLTSSKLKIVPEDRTIDLEINKPELGHVEEKTKDLLYLLQQANKLDVNKELYSLLKNQSNYSEQLQKLALELDNHLRTMEKDEQNKMQQS